MRKTHPTSGLLLLALALSAAPPAAAAEDLRSAQASLKPDLGDGILGVRVQLTNSPGNDVDKAIAAFLPSLAKPPFTPVFRGQPLVLAPDPQDPLRLWASVGITNGGSASKRAFGCFGGWYASLDNVSRTEVDGYLAEPTLSAAEVTLKHHAGALRDYTGVHGATCESITDIHAEIFIVEHVRRYLLLRSHDSPVPESMRAFDWLLDPAYGAAYQGASADLQHDKLAALKGWVDEVAAFSLPASFTPDFTPVAARLDHDQTESKPVFVLHALSVLVSQDKDTAARVAAADFNGLRGTALLLDTLVNGCADPDGQIHAQACGSGALNRRFVWLTFQTQAAGALRLMMPLAGASG